MVEKTPHDKHAVPFDHLQRMQHKQEPAPATPTAGKSCGRCLYMEIQRTGALNIDKIMVCKRFPPNITISPVQRPGGQTGVANLTGFPHVNAGMWCWEFKEIEEVIKDDTTNSLPAP